MFEEIVPSGSSKRTSMRESAELELAAQAQAVFGANKRPAAPIPPCCKKSRRFIITASSVAAVSGLHRDSQTLINWRRGFASGTRLYRYTEQTFASPLEFTSLASGACL